MKFIVRPAQAADADSIEALFPRLAAFDIPSRRVPSDLWQGDKALFVQWLEGQACGVFVSVAVDAVDTVLGVAMIQLRDEWLSHAPSAHLEVVAVAEAAQGCGIGRALVEEAEQLARAQGALSITLHVFHNNSRARSLYQRLGYDAELIRYIKEIS